MQCFVCIVVLCGSVAFGQGLPNGLLPAAESPVAVGLPGPPPGHSTVMGGQIEKVDLVRDQLSLKVPGGHAVRILFDERTQVYLDGKKMSVLNLHPEDHASVETALDGTAIFALRIHMLSSVPGGQLRGQIVSFNPATRELKLRVTESSDTVVLVADPAMPVVRVGQSAFAEQKAGSLDLVSGAVVDVTFKAGKTGPGAATRVEVLAIPGAEFVFHGNLSFLDLRAGRMAVANPSDGQTMEVAFDPAHFATSQDLHLGATVRVTARFDGTRYVASQISVE